jgi:predicted metal-dependent hydrolase
MQLQLPFVGVSEEPAGAIRNGRSAPVPPTRSITPPVPPPVSEDRVEFVRTHRAKRYILRVQPDGSLRVTVPRWGSKREALQFVASQRRWIERQRQRVHVAYTPREWREGTEILLRGEPVRLTILAEGEDARIEYGDRRVELRDGCEIRAAIEADLKALAKAELPERLRELARDHDLKPRRVVIRNQRSRWGSCARNGNIALNFRLVQMPPAVRDYVLVHELMHMRQQNHSRRFWRFVEHACPDFRAAERWLRVHGRALF